jgi:hypothetical protein
MSGRRNTRPKEAYALYTFSARQAIACGAAVTGPGARGSSFRRGRATRDSRSSRNASNSLKTLGRGPSYLRRSASRVCATDSADRCRPIPGEHTVRVRPAGLPRKELAVEGHGFDRAKDPRAVAPPIVLVRPREGKLCVFHESPFTNHKSLHSNRGPRRAPARGGVNRYTCAIRNMFKLHKTKDWRSL